MNTSGSKGERSIALFLLGILLFNPPLLSIFGGDVEVAGVPLLYLYLFLAWGVFILLIGVISETGQERRRSRRLPLPGNDNPAERSAVPQRSLPHSIGPPPSLQNRNFPTTSVQVQSTPKTQVTPNTPATPKAHPDQGDEPC